MYKCIFIFVLIFASNANAFNCKDVKFLAEYEFSSFNREGVYRTQYETRDLPKVWNQNDDVILAIVITGISQDVVPEILVNYSKNNKKFKSLTYSRTDKENYKNYYTLNNNFFLNRSDNPFIAEVIININEMKCSHTINIGEGN